MGKIRVYELAKEAGKESKELTAMLIEQGYDIKSHSSTLDEAAADEIRQKLGLVETTTERTRIQAKGKTTIIRRRKKTVRREEPVEAPVEEEPEVEVAAPVAETVDVETSDAEGHGVAEAKSEIPVSEPVAPAEDKIAAVSDVAVVDAEETAEPVTSSEAAEVETSAPDVAPPVATEVMEETAAKVREEKEPEEVAEVAEKTAKEPEKEVAATEKVEEKPTEKTTAEKPQKSRKGLARVIKRAAIILPPETTEKPRHARPKRTEKPKGRPPAPRANQGPGPGNSTGPADDSAKGKGGGGGKKGKRFVKFHPEPANRERFKKGKKKGRVEVAMEDVDSFGGRLPANLRLGRSQRSGKRNKHVVEEVQETKAIKKRIKVFETISVGDMAHRMGAKSNEVIAKLMALGVMATVNQALDIDTATLIATDFGYEVEQGATEAKTILRVEDSEGGGEEFPRPPVVTVMGHVDHGKTSILDAIRKTDVASGEAGGITQHIGAHYVRSAQGDVVFLDTPGHAAFTEMRSRGAQVTDIVVLVVAADDGVMDQTREAINHAKAADVPIVVAVNKIDKANADTNRVKAELAEYDLTPEEWGGTTIFCETSAKEGQGIDELLEQILLQSEMLELKADPKRRARGWAVEAQLHKGRGPVATVLIQHGTLRVGDNFVVGEHYGRVRSMRSDKGEALNEAGPSTPVEVHGLSGVPRAGDEFIAVPDEKMARTVSAERHLKVRENELATTTKISLDNLFDHLKEEEIKELRVVLRSDVQGTLEAFGTAIEKLSTDAIKVKIIHQGTGAIIESDVLLASASEALIFGFNVRPNAQVQEVAKNENVDIRFYDVIYHALDDIRLAMTGMLEPTFVEKVTATVEVREIFHHPKAGTIAGCYVTDGKVERNALVRILRDGVVVYTGKPSSVRRFKDDVKEVQTGFECGISLENYNDIKAGDILEFYQLEEVAGVL